MSIEKAKAELLRKSDANDAYANFLTPGIANLVGEKAPFDVRNFVLADKPWLAPQQPGESLARLVNSAIRLTEQFANSCEPGQHHKRSPEDEARDQKLQIVDFEMGVSARLENMRQRAEEALGHLTQAGEGCETLVTRLAHIGETIKENNQFFVAEAQNLRNQAEQL